MSDLVTASLKVVGLVLGLFALRSATQLVAFRIGMGGAPMEDAGSYVFWTGLYVVAEGAVALALLFRTDGVVHWVVGNAAAESLELGPATELAAAAMTVAGSVVALRALPHVVSDGAEIVWLMGKERRNLNWPYVLSNWTEYLFWIASLAIGILVARRASRLLKRPSSVGDQSPDAS